MNGDQQSIISQRWFNNAFWIIIALFVIWLILAIWPDWLVGILGRKKVFVNALLNGITLGALYFLVASGFTLIFGLMRNVNLAHGSLYLAGAYIGFEVSRMTGSWVLAFPVAFIAMALLGVILQVFVFRHLCLLYTSDAADE